MGKNRIKGYIKQLGDNKGTIMWAATLSMVVAAVVVCFLPRRYRVRSQVVVLPPVVTTNFGSSSVSVNFKTETDTFPSHGDFHGVVDGGGISMPIFRQIALSALVRQEVLERTGDKTLTQGKWKKMYTATILERKVNFGQHRQAPLLTLEVTMRGAESAQKVVNTWAQIVCEKINEASLSRLSSAYAFAKETSAQEQQEMFDRQKKVIDFEKSVSIPLLEKEASLTLRALAECIKQLQSARSTFPAGGADRPSDEGQSVTKQSLSARRDELTEELLKVQGQLQEKKYALEELQRAFRLSEMRHEVLEKKKLQLQIAQEERPVRAIVLVQAFRPRRAVWPNRKRVVILAGILGLLLSSALICVRK